MTITREGLDKLAERVNDMLEARGSIGRVTIQGQNGGYALDLTTTEHSVGTCVRSLRFGTKSELEDYLRAMQEALWLLDEPFMPVATF